VSYPTLDFERELLEKYQVVVGIDEVGRGALAGPVAVGAFVLTNTMLEAQPQGLRDSKLISEPKRAAVAAEVANWGQGAVGFSSVEMIESRGISHALEAAAASAVAKLDLTAAVILLDGSHNWLSGAPWPVITKTKADRDCGSVAAASVLAKVARDEVMRELAHSHSAFGWDSNKGYSSAGHIAAIRTSGPSEHHRKSWLSKILSEDQGLF
jgi:ribonuclease HII